jgi:hypothetical protein
MTAPAAQRQYLAAAAGAARVRSFGVCPMPAASWSTVLPILGVDTDRKHVRPRWPRVSSQ